MWACWGLQHGPAKSLCNLIWIFASRDIGFNGIRRNPGILAGAVSGREFKADFQVWIVVNLFKWCVIFNLPDIPGALCNWRDLCLVFKFSGYHDRHFLVIHAKNHLNPMMVY